MRSLLAQLSIGLLLPLAACATSPPLAWLRYRPTPAADWTTAATGELTTRCGGAEVRVQSHPRRLLLEVTVDNPGDQDLEVRIGVQGPAPTWAVGEVRRQPPRATRGEGMVRAQPYLAHAPLRLDRGWRAWFELDGLLEREPTIGHYLVLEIEVGVVGQAVRERRLLPMVASNVPYPGPAGGR